MFTVFEDVKKCEYKRTMVVKDAQTKVGKSQLEKVEGPLEAKGKTFFFCLYN